MKKVGVLFFVFLVFLAFAFAEQTNDSSNPDAVRAEKVDAIKERVAERAEARSEVRAGLREMRGNYVEEIDALRELYREDREGLAREAKALLDELESADLSIEEKEALRSELRDLIGEGREMRKEYVDEAKGIRVEYGESMGKYVGEFREKYKLRDGREVDVKVMPEVASEKAIERLRLKRCNESNNCSIELKEVGEGEKARLAYALKAKKQGRFLGIFKTEMDVESEVDAESGEVIRSRKPWWAFLVNE